MHLPEPARVVTLWISSIGRKTEDNRNAIGIQCRISSNSRTKNGQTVATFRREALLSKEKLAESDDIVGRCVGEDVGRKQAGTKCPAQSEADSFVDRAQFDGEKVEDGRVRCQIEDGVDALFSVENLAQIAIAAVPLAVLSNSIAKPLIRLPSETLTKASKSFVHSPP